MIIIWIIGYCAFIYILPTVQCRITGYNSFSLHEQGPQSTNRAYVHRIGRDLILLCLLCSVCCAQYYIWMDPPPSAYLDTGCRNYKLHEYSLYSSSTVATQSSRSHSLPDMSKERWLTRCWWRICYLSQKQMCLFDNISDLNLILTGSLIMKELVTLRS